MNVKPSRTRSAPDEPAEPLVRALSEERDEPDWMTRFRCECLSIYRNHPGPASSGHPVESRLRFDEPSPFLNNADGSPGGSSSGNSERIEALKEQGVFFRPLREAIRDRPELVRSHFMQRAVRPEQSRFAALHGAFWNSGTFVYVPEHVQVDLPLTVFHRNTSGTRFLFPHQLIVAEPGSQLRFVEGCSAPAGDRTETIAGVVELLAGPNASIRYSTLQNWGPGAVNVTKKRAVLDRNASVDWISGNIGSRSTDMIPTSVLTGRGAGCRHLDFTLATDGQQLRTGARVHHRAPDTRSSVTVRAASDAGGTTTSRTEITVTEGSHGTESQISSDGLMLADTAAVRTKHETNVDERRVTLEQNGTISNPSRRNRFYLRSRGLRESDARLTLLDGFLRPVSDALPPEFAVELRKQVRRTMQN